MNPLLKEGEVKRYPLPFREAEVTWTKLVLTEAKTT